MSHYPYPLEALHQNGCAAMVAEALRACNRHRARCDANPRGVGSELAVRDFNYARRFLEGLLGGLSIVYGVTTADLARVVEEFYMRDHDPDACKAILARLRERGLGRWPE